MVSGPRLRLVGCESALNPRWFILSTVLRRWSQCWSYSFLLCGYSTRRSVLSLVLCYFVLVFFSPFSIAFPCLGNRELILVLLVRLFDLHLFGFVCFLFLLVSVKGCVFSLTRFCDCSTPWTLIFPFWSNI